MKVTQTSLPGVLLLEPVVHEDARGYLFESYNEHDFTQHTGIRTHFVQDNHARSMHNVLRGLHYQIRQAQGKLVRVISGAVFDVSVDLRRSSPAFGRWTGVHLSAENKNMLWIPEGFAHGYLTLSKTSDLLYKTNNYYSPPNERCMLWNDPDIGIEWPLNGDPILAAKDCDGTRFKNAELFD